MTIKNTNSDRREGLGFVQAVVQHLAPLLRERGFIPAKETPYAVKFQSPTVVLEVLHDPVSYEVAITFSRQGGAAEQYDLRSMLDAVLGPGHKEEGFFQASEPDRVIMNVKAISDLMQKYGAAVLAGDPLFYQKMGQSTLRQDEMYTKKVMQQPVRKAAEDAWRQYDYARVRELYHPIQADLTPIEKKRLQYARNIPLTNNDDAEARAGPLPNVVTHIGEPGTR